MAKPDRPTSPKLPRPGSQRLVPQRSSGRVVSPGVVQGELQLRTASQADHTKQSAAEFKLGVDEVNPAENVPEDQVKVVDESGQGSGKFRTWLSRFGMRGD